MTPICKELNLDPQCSSCRDSDSKIKCYVEWFSNCIKENSSRDEIKRIFERESKFDEVFDTELTYYLVNTIRAFYPQYINFINTLVLLK